MNQSPILAGVHSAEDIETADDLTKKHTPFISTSRDGDIVTIEVEVGHYMAHPNLPDHWIEMLEIRVAGAAIATLNLAGGVVAPTLTAKAMLDPGTTIEVHERCNLHGLWVSTAAV